MASTIKFTFDDGGMSQRIEIMEVKLKGAVGILVDYASLKGMEHLKTDAPWTDRTGAARAGLHTISFSGGDKYTIIFSHAVHYGIWLEVKFSGRDEVIMPTVRKTGRDLMQSLDGLLGRI